MRIVQVAAEFAPLAKAGGLGEVILGLSRELTQSPELEVDVIIPKYDFIDLKKIRNINMEVPDFKCFEKGVNQANAMWSGLSEDCRVHLLEARHPAGYFHRGKIYGEEDDISRFIYFSRAVLEYLRAQNRPIDILHLHDWHVSLCAPLARDLFTDLKIKAIILTVHNSEYQGRCTPADLDHIGLKGEEYLQKDKFPDNAPGFSKTLNLLKGGIVYADAVTTVSPNFAKELLTPEMGFHLESTFRKYKSKLTGILNGIDQTIWNPATDPLLAAHYDASSSISIQKGKEANREAFRSRTRFIGTRRPWVGTISRITFQKGPDLIEEGIKKTVELGGTFILLGSPPEAKLKAQFDNLKQQFADHPQVFIQYTYDESLAHLIYAALDFVLVPSIFEPCGLTQLIAMRYGSVPIVRSTGGLKDTVFDCENSLNPIQVRNGFVFSQPTREALDGVLKRAFDHFKQEPHTFLPMVQRSMKQDYSWKNPTLSYLKLYRKALSEKPSFLPIAAAGER